jgi:hypothetical protein
MTSSHEPIDDPARAADAAWAECTAPGPRRDDPGRAAFEARAVQHVLKRCGMPMTLEGLVRLAWDRTGDPTVSFALLHHAVPDFPIRLGVARLYYLKENLTLEQLFRRPQSAPPYRAFHDWAEEDQVDDAEAARGLIFRLPGCPGHGNRAILHTYNLPVGAAAGTQVRFAAIERKALVGYTLEPLDQLLEHLLRTYHARDDRHYM